MGWEMCIKPLCHSRFGDSSGCISPVLRLVQILDSFLLSHVWVRIEAAHLQGETTGRVESAHLAGEKFA
jgi:hypothetical protein